MRAKVTGKSFMVVVLTVICFFCAGLMGSDCVVASLQRGAMESSKVAKEFRECLREGSRQSSLKVLKVCGKIYCGFEDGGRYLPFLKGLPVIAEPWFNGSHVNDGK